MVERYLRSGQTRRAFCESEGVALSTLDWWLRKGKARSGTSGIAFREVKGVSSPMESSAAWLMEIVSPQGWTIRTRQALSVREMGRLLRESPC